MKGKDGGGEGGEGQGTAKAKTARVIGKRRVNVTQRTMPTFRDYAVDFQY